MRMRFSVHTMPMRINFFTQPSRLHHDLDHFALVHGPIAFGNFVETDHMKEDTARVPIFPSKTFREQLLYVRRGSRASTTTRSTASAKRSPTSSRATRWITYSSAIGAEAPFLRRRIDWTSLPNRACMLCHDSDGNASVIALAWPFVPGSGRWKRWHRAGAQRWRQSCPKPNRQPPSSATLSS